MSETTEQTTQQTGATQNDAGTLREVPKDISEYKKFVAEGGHEHNEKVLGHEAAVAAAKAAGIVPDSETGEAQERKNKNGFQQRVARLQRKIGERDQRIADLQKRLGAAPASNGAAPAANGTAPAKAAPAKAEDKPAHAPAGASQQGADKTPPKPVEKDFKTYAEFVEALTDWKTARALEEHARNTEESKRASEAETKTKAITDAHNARVDEAKTRYPDWDKAFKGLTDESFTDPMVVFIFESEHGPDVTYYLATHRDELDRIRALSPLRQAAALGRIESQFESDDDAGGKSDDEEETEGEREKEKPAPAAKKTETPEPKPQPKRVSSAPPPAKPLGGKGGGDDPMPDPKDFKAYEAWSKRQAARGVKR